MTSEPIYTKVCNICKSEKAINEFYKNKSSKDGLRSNCKQCSSKSDKLYHDSNKSTIADKRKSWRDNNKENISTINKQWYENNRHIVNSFTAKRRATKLQATPSWCEAEQIKSLYIMSKQMTEQTGIEHQVDHIVPLQSDIVCGLHCLANLRIITASENLVKSNSYWPDMP